MSEPQTPRDGEPTETAGPAAESTPSTPPAGGRRAARAEEPAPTGRRAGGGGRRIDLLVGLAVALPAVVLASVAVIGAEADPVPSVRPPAGSELTDSTLVCPPPVAAGDAEVLALRVPEVAGGEVTVRSGRTELRRESTIEVPDQAPVEVPRASGVVTLEAQGEAAPGLVAGRREPSVAAPCRAPAYDEWFLGLGATARNGSVLTLVNPDDSNAVVDVTLIGPSGPIEEDAGRGVTIQGHQVLRVDLAAEAPRRIDVAAHLSVSRGRVSMTVEHSWDPLGAGQPSTDTLPAQPRASAENLLLGVAPGGVQKYLYVANPGDDEVRATVRVMTAEAVFTPSDSDDVVVPPQSQVRVPLRSLVSEKAEEGMIGLVVEGSGPLLSTVRSLVRGDLAAVGGAELLRAPAAVVVPEGDARLVLGGARRPGVVQVRAYDSRGTVLGEDARVEVAADRGATLDLPEGTAALTLVSGSTPVAASLVVTSNGGTAVVPVRPSGVRADVPSVAPR
ncbi:hypothetical protein E8D34_06325 [Nocardioides sp. GY 10113]|uniref:DUF5719 family protein n=1 Tax=Nocardioides sp. GY 10113 TaxID=2569761 RepID=UPI0010A83017|nr:DUF5719 family protein [Nocardioides sp. GY 10113]TIC87911.1 hypothetical protein E8D34_06325 [Nocardioides sp. GY 10113]